ncbi:GATA-4/5/6 transcription factor [Mycena alexandri]|uniref:GATA-4/5/6 transcription factor n=1 Tax=Mycena alexandri TaxID=1745969 RepID=A0AAD6X1J8_9AGAR|nr:GATA-4/5/6 transcription factor [Mycena alexandri]
MDLIRTKRALTTAGTGAAGGGLVGANGQPKSKYRKRSVSGVSLMFFFSPSSFEVLGFCAPFRSRHWSGQRATPPGKCHSCNIRETPEWRRGPDGARTLCNACGLHYAKLMRKREKEGGTSQIDMDTLRASARADQAEKSSARANKQAAAAANKASFSASNAATAAASDSAQPPPPPPPLSHHEGSFQLTLAPSLSPSEVQAQMGARAHVPPPPPPTAWATQRAYAPEQLQHQSFLRTPQVVGGQASPR